MLLIVWRDSKAFLLSGIQALISFAFLEQAEIESFLFFLIKYALHLVWIQLDFEEERLEELHVRKVVVVTLIIVDKFALHALELALLIFQNSQLVVETFPLSLIHLADISKTGLDDFDNGVELLDINFEDCACLADALGAIRVWTYASYVLKTKKITRTHHNYFLSLSLYLVLFDWA